MKKNHKTQVQQQPQIQNKKYYSNYILKWEEVHQKKEI